MRIQFLGLYLLWNHKTVAVSVSSTRVMVRLLPVFDEIHCGVSITFGLRACAVGVRQARSSVVIIAFILYAIGLFVIGLYA